MTVTSVDQDLDNLTLTVIADFEAPLHQVWQLWADPRKLERWWGPPGFPATFEQHDLRPDGEVRYAMTSEEGERFPGLWRITSVQAPTGLAFVDHFVDAEGAVDPNMPATTVSVELSESAGGSRIVIRSGFATREQMQQLLDLGMAEGMRQALGQADAVLAG